jgi:hypothetical protein
VKRSRYTQTERPVQPVRVLVVDDHAEAPAQGGGGRVARRHRLG